MRHSDEHVDVAEFDLDALRAEPIPEGYLRAIELATTALGRMDGRVTDPFAGRSPRR
ncbi:MAG: hypothetical protein R2707_13375 [Acidimicrobiales bacterium]